MLLLRARARPEDLRRSADRDAQLLHRHECATRLQYCTLVAAAGADLRYHSAFVVRVLATHAAPVLWRSDRVAHCGRLRLLPSDG
jgi:hypothetical protein